MPSSRPPFPGCALVTQTPIDGQTMERARRPARKPGTKGPFWHLPRMRPWPCHPRRSGYMPRVAGRAWACPLLPRPTQACRDMRELVLWLVPLEQLPAVVRENQATAGFMGYGLSESTLRPLSESLVIKRDESSPVASSSPLHSALSVSVSNVSYVSKGKSNIMTQGDKYFNAWRKGAELSQAVFESPNHQSSVLTTVPCYCLLMLGEVPYMETCMNCV